MHRSKCFRATAILAVALSFCDNSKAEEVSTFTAPLSRGHWKVGGSFSYAANANFQMATVAPSAEYFVFDRLSIGGSLRGTWTSDGTMTDLSPSITYYFLMQDRLAYYVNQKINFSASSYGGTYLPDLSTSVGASYFLTPDIAFGPQLELSYGPNQATILNVLGAFSIYF